MPWRRTHVVVGDDDGDGPVVFVGRGTTAPALPHTPGAAASELLAALARPISSRRRAGQPVNLERDMLVTWGRRTLEGIS
jgi:hypothetical protein